MNKASREEFQRKRQNQWQWKEKTAFSNERYKGEEKEEKRAMNFFTR